MPGDQNLGSAVWRMFDSRIKKQSNSGVDPGLKASHIQKKEGLRYSIRFTLVKEAKRQADKSKSKHFAFRYVLTSVDWWWHLIQ